MSYFPIILIPQQIERVKSAEPPVPIFTEPLPQQPGKEPQKLNATIIAVETTAAVPTVAIVSQGQTIPGLLLLLAAVGAIAAHAWHQIKSYPERKQKHKDKVADYHRELKSYESKKREHEKEVGAARSPQRLAEFRYKLLMQILSQTIPHDGDQSTAITNPEEARFCNRLSQCFPGKIYTRLTPDFSRDVEREERFASGSGEPVGLIFCI